LTDSSIHIKLKRGDIEAYEQLFTVYYPPLCLFAKKIVNDNEKARDIVQDVFVTLYAQRANLDIHTSLKSYLFRCVNNACLNELRQVKSHMRHHEGLKMESEFTLLHDEITYAELQSRIRLTVDKLPAQCRKIFEMSRFEGQKNREIAAHLGISIRTVETQISKALGILRAHLADYLSLIFLEIFF
jgi:RNA polymerase sigma-70 factor (family 1)